MNVEKLGRFPILATEATISSGESKSLVRWLQTSMGILQSAASSDDFFSKAARAVVEMVGLDSGQVLVWENDAWQVRAAEVAAGMRDDVQRPPSRTILDAIRREKRTFRQFSSSFTGNGDSLVGVSALIAAPILNREGEVIGAVYGNRWECHNVVGDSTTELEAMLVELIASGVAAGLARLHQEKAALTRACNSSNFLPPALPTTDRPPGSAHGRDAEVSLLFCDIRGFSGISERLGPTMTVQWISDVMGTLSDAVAGHRGVLVDYIGDELLAMWGVLEEQPDHAQLACRAALQMLASIPQLNARWQASLGRAMAVGIGINTGVVHIGNIGSRHKFKYGPLGNAVNVASRLQGATKYLRCRC